MARVLGHAVVPVLVAPIRGPVVAGAILKRASWPWLFYVNLPVGILAVSLAVVLLPPDEASATRRPFDVTGFLLISPGLVALLYGFERTSHGGGVLGIGVLAVGVALVLAFIVYARRAGASALIDLRLFQQGIFANAAVTQCLNNGMLYASQFLVPLYLVTGAGLTPDRVGSPRPACRRDGLRLPVLLPFLGLAGIQLCALACAMRLPLRIGDTERTTA